MNIKRPLMPGFLKRAEQKLLLNKPGIWSTRAHLVLYYGVLFLLLLTGICFLEPTDIRQSSTADYWIGFVIIISIIGLTVWLIYLLRFNVFKKYGNIQPLYGLVTFILYFIATGLLVLFVFISPIVECVRANIAFGDEEMVQDINNMNIKLCQVEYDLLQTKWDYDSVAIIKAKTAEEKIAYQEDNTRPAPYIERGRSFYQLDSTAFNDRLAKTDSLVKVNDTLYLMYKTPTLEFVTSYWANDAMKEKILSSFQIYNKALRHPPTMAERAAINKDLGLLLDKYRYIKNKGYYEGYYGEEIKPTDTPYEIVHKRYKVGAINSAVWNIAHKKDRFSGKHLSDYIRAFYYFTLGISLLIFIFRHTTVRTFFLSLLTAVLLIIFTALVLSFSHADSATFFAWMIAYTLVFFIGTLFIWSGTKRKVVSGILLNLFVFIVPIFPLLVAGWYYEWKRQRWYKHYGAYDELDKIESWLFYAEIGGAVLFLVLLATYIGKVYRRWYSLPEH